MILVKHTSCTAMDFEDQNNIFLKAAMTGKVTSPNYSSTTTSFSASGSTAELACSSATLPNAAVNNTGKTMKGKGQLKRVGFSDAEDILIQVAYGHHKSDYRAMVRFLKNHLEILPKMLAITINQVTCQRANLKPPKSE